MVKLLRYRSADDFNQAHEVGESFKYYPILDNDRHTFAHNCHTISPAYEMCGEVVVMINAISGCVSVNNLGTD